MERLSYDEAREWFWIRTAAWFAPAALASVMAHFAFASDLIGPFGVRVWVCLGEGLAVALVGVLVATLSMQLPWMRGGWRSAGLLNGPVCAAFSAFLALLLSGIVLSFLQSSPPNQFQEKAAYQAYLEIIDVALAMMKMGIFMAAVWGFLFGSWFALRLDRYFVEPV